MKIAKPIEKIARTSTKKDSARFKSPAIRPKADKPTRQRDRPVKIVVKNVFIVLTPCVALFTLPLSHRSRRLLDIRRAFDPIKAGFQLCRSESRKRDGSLFLSLIFCPSR